MRSHAMQPRLRMTETLLSLIALGFISWLVMPAMSLATSDVQHTVLSERVRAVRAAVDFQRHSELVRTTRGGWPMSINATWFPGETMPAHPATDRSFTIEVVDGAIDEIAPLAKTFDPRQSGSYTLWYNRSNGALCARVPLGDSDERTLLAFNLANSLGLESLSQTHTTP